MIRNTVVVFIVLFSIKGYSQCGSPPTINFANNTVDICLGESGSNTATVIGAVGVVDYNWSATSSTTNSITASPVTSTWYYLEITDDCFTVVDSFLMDVHEVDFVLQATSPVCYGFSDGNVDVTILAGSGGYSVTIGNAAGSQVNIGGWWEANQLPSGWYFVSVTDVNGCFAEDSIFVSEPGELNVDLTLTHPFCFDDNSGMAVVDTIYNFAGNYTTIGYYWNPNPSGTNGAGQDTCENLGPGDYTLVINDQNGCSLVTDFTITSTNSEMYFIELGSEPWSETMDGVVYASAGGGTPPYITTWTNLSNMDTETNTVWGLLLPGDYAVEVVDANGCTLNDTISVGYLGTEEMTEELVKIFPTLVSDGLLNCANSFSDDVLFTVYNLQGEIVFVSGLHPGMTQVKLDVVPGSYFYRITNTESDAEIQSGRFVAVSE